MGPYCAWLFEGYVALIHSAFRLAIGWVVAVIFVMGLSIHLCFSSPRPRTSPTDQIRQRTDDILQTAKYQTDPPTPGTIEAIWSLDLKKCGSLLPEAMRRNNNQYSIVVVGVWGDGASPIPGGTGAIQAAVNVVFPNGTRVEMQYYQYTLEVCRELPL
jgi:hypothetical protein